MKKQIIFLVSFCVLLSPLSTSAFDDGDWQYWNTNTITGTLVEPQTDLLESVNARMQGKWRWGNDLGDYYYQQIDVGLSMNRVAVDWLSLGLYYKNCWQKSFSVDRDTWYEERRPYLTITTSFRVAGWAVDNRVQVERRLFDEALSGRAVAWRFRDRLGFAAPVEWTAACITPYLSEEIFNDDLSGGINQNRLIAGISIGRLFLPERLKGDISLMWLTLDTGDSWQDGFIIGTNLIVAFH